MLDSLMRLDPIQDTLIVTPDSKPTHSPAGVLIPDNARHALVTGTVVAKGPGMARKRGGTVVPIQVEVGDRVFFEKHMGTEMPHAGKTVLLLRERFIHAVLGATTVVELVETPAPAPQSLSEDTDMPDIRL
jgi:chaperonin GroES